MTISTAGMRRLNQDRNVQTRVKERIARWWHAAHCEECQLKLKVVNMGEMPPGLMALVRQHLEEQLDSQEETGNGKAH